MSQEPTPEDIFNQAHPEFCRQVTLFTNESEDAKATHAQGIFDSVQLLTSLVGTEYDDYGQQARTALLYIYQGLPMRSSLLSFPALGERYVDLDKALGILDEDLAAINSDHRNGEDPLKLLQQKDIWGLKGDIFFRQGKYPETVEAYTKAGVAYFCDSKRLLSLADACNKMGSHMWQLELTCLSQIYRMHNGSGHNPPEALGSRIVDLIINYNSDGLKGALNAAIINNPVLAVTLTRSLVPDHQRILINPNLVLAPAVKPA